MHISRRKHGNPAGNSSWHFDADDTSNGLIVAIDRRLEVWISSLGLHQRDCIPGNFFSVTIDKRVCGVQ